MTRQLPCWIDHFIEATKTIPSPELFRKWVAISAVAGALERRVYTESAASRVYPNLYVLLVAPPGVGKSMAIFQIMLLWEATRKLKVAPDDITKASLLDHLAQAHQFKTYPDGTILEYHSLQLAADELGVLVPAHDTGFLSVLNKLFDNPPKYKESRRGRDGDLNMLNPQINLLAGTQPDFLANLLPDEAWGMGFMSRMLMVYQGKSTRPRLFGPKGNRKLKNRVDTKSLVADLKVIAELHGEVDWTDEAAEALEEWNDKELAPVPNHSKLKHYVPRRILTMLKLSLISAISRSNSMIITEPDVRRAQDWLLEIEALMPDVFKDMGGKGDGELIKELHYHVYELFIKADKKPIHRSRIETFLMARTPTYNIEKIIDLCKSTGILKEVMPDMFQPGTENTLRSE